MPAKSSFNVRNHKENWHFRNAFQLALKCVFCRTNQVWGRWKHKNFPSNARPLIAHHSTLIDSKVKFLIVWPKESRGNLFILRYASGRWKVLRPCWLWTRYAVGGMMQLTAIDVEAWKGRRGNLRSYCVQIFTQLNSTQPSRPIVKPCKARLQKNLWQYWFLTSTHASPSLE